MCLGQLELEKLLLITEGLSTEALTNSARDLFNALYITSDERHGLMDTHDGDTVVFYADRFHHAFFTSPDRIRHPNLKTVLDSSRVRRIRWIGELIRGNVKGSACWEIPEYNYPGAPIGKRLYITDSHLFVVWLESNSSPTVKWRFSSAYVAHARDTRQYTKGATRIWRLEK